MLKMEMAKVMLKIVDKVKAVLVVVHLEILETVHLDLEMVHLQINQIHKIRLQVMHRNLQMKQRRQQIKPNRMQILVKVLKKMQRHVTKEDTYALIEKMRREVPGICIRTTMMVGFPGETEEEFRQTLDYCEKIGFAKIHVFPYSKREGTPAAEMPDQIPEPEKEKRVHRLMALENRTATAYRESLLGETRSVLLEEPLADGRMAGYTPEYVQVAVGGGQSGQLGNVLLTGLTPEGLEGRIVE